ncbi:MAG TPA: hypothetical protein VGW74_20230, partial [Propionibacteriaceae bacterium]|nr:hypothetical protein [Propionibacteriaceae bacterium]
AGMHQRDQELLVRAANRVMGILPQRYFQVIDGKVMPCNATDPGAKPCAVLDSLDGNYLVGQLLENRARVAALEAEVRALRGENVNVAELRAAVDAELEELMAEWQQMVDRPDTEEAKR